MPRVFGLVFAITAALALSAGSGAGASSKLAYTGAIQFPSGNLLLTLDEAGQKRFTSVDYQLTATATAKTCDLLTGQCIATLYYPTDTVAGLVPDDKGHVTTSLTLDQVPGGGGLCSCTLHMEYSDVTLTNLASGHVYRLDPIAGDSP